MTYWVVLYMVTLVTGSVSVWCIVSENVLLHFYCYDTNKTSLES